MKVILIEKVATLGNVGEVVNVSPGHARNYLFPRKFAVLADASRQKQLENQKRRLQKKIQVEVDAANVVKAKIEGKVIELVKRVGANGKLFGAITNADLAKELAVRDVVIERRQIVLEAPIKGLGNFDAKVKLFTGVEATFKVKVMMDPKQVEELKAKEIEAKKRKAEEKIAKEKAEKEAAEAAAKAALQQDE